MPDVRRIKEILDKKATQYNVPEFILNDPISIPHRYNRLQDIEISGFFASIFAWGLRKTTINKCKQLMDLMGDAPYEFCLHHSKKDLKRLLPFCHRTFNSSDLLYFIEFFRHHYQRFNSLEDAFFNHQTLKQSNITEAALNYFHDYFFSLPYVMERTKKHIAAPKKNSACKRLNMFLRWMVREDAQAVDFGLWKKIDPSELICPLDLHVARVARHLHLLERKQNDWNAAVELTAHLRALDPEDPVKYDYALFGMGIMESV